MNTSSSFKFVKFFLNSFIVHFCNNGLDLNPLPAESTLTKVVDAPYPIPPLCILIETIFPDEFNSGTSLASDPIPNTTNSGGEL